MAFRIAPIVEGHGEVRAVPELLRRLIAELNFGVQIEIVRPIRQARGSLLKAGGIENAVQLAAIGLDEGAILLLVDSEGEPPCQLGPALLGRAKSARPDQNISVVLAHHEFEAWFLAAASTLNLNRVVEDHAEAESIRNCKGWLETRLSKYAPSVDQVRLAAIFDLTRARRAPSFDKLWREIAHICEDARAAVEDV